MSQTKFLKGECAHCGGRMEFAAEAIGTVVDCPHCGKQTELMLALPPQQSSLPVKGIVLTIVAVVILGLGLVGAMVALKRAERMAARQKARASAAAAPQSPAVDQAQKTSFSVSEITLEKTAGSSLVHAVGTVSNTTARQRFGVTVEVDLFDASGKKLGTAKDYHPTLEPNSQWRFKALVMDSKAASARLASIKDE